MAKPVKLDPRKGNLSGRERNDLIESVLAIWFGRKLLRFARSPIMAYIIAMLIVVSVAGSGLAIRSWIKRSKTLHAAE